MPQGMARLIVDQLTHPKASYEMSFVGFLKSKFDINKIDK
jgi:hypothetical protein